MGIETNKFGNCATLHFLLETDLKKKSPPNRLDEDFLFQTNYQYFSEQLFEED